MSRLTDILQAYADHAATREAVLQCLATADIVIMAAHGSAQEEAIFLQTYMIYGQPYHPIFSDIETARRLLKDVQMQDGMDLFGTNGSFLFSLLNRPRWLILNPSDTLSFTFDAHEVRPDLAKAKIPLGSPSQGDEQNHRTIVLDQPTTVQIGLPQSMPDPKILEAMKNAVTSTGANEVYWFWLSIDGGIGHLGIAVAPPDTRVTEQVGRAINPIWAAYNPKNTLVTVMMLNASEASAAIRAQGRLLFSTTTTNVP